jgi:hypothetical protein
VSSGDQIISLARRVADGDRSARTLLFKALQRSGEGNVFQQGQAVWYAARVVYRHVNGTSHLGWTEDWAPTIAMDGDTNRVLLCGQRIRFWRLGSWIPLENKEVPAHICKTCLKVAVKAYEEFLYGPGGCRRP